MTDIVLLGEGFGLEDDEGEPPKISLLELPEPSLAEGVELLGHLSVVLAVLHLDLVLVIFLRKMKIKIIFLRKMKILHLDRHVEDVRRLPALASLQLCLFNGTDPESKSFLRDKYVIKVLRDKYVIKSCPCCVTLTLNPRHCQAHSRRVQKCCRSRKGTLQRCQRQQWLQCAGTRQRSRGRARS